MAALTRAKSILVYLPSAVYEAGMKQCNAVDREESAMPPGIN